MLPTSTPIYQGLKNYARLLTLPETGIAFKNTAVYILGLLPLSVILPVIIALVTNRIGGRARTIYRALIFTPMIMAPVVVSTVWSWILGPTAGVLNALVTGIFKTPTIHFFTDQNMAIWVIIFITGWKLTGFSTLIFSAAITNISPDYIEAANIDGATYLQVVRRIILPLISPALLLMTMLSVLLSSQWSFVYINELTQGGPLNSTTNLYYLLWEYGFGTFAVGWSSAAAMIVIIVFGLIALIFLRLNRRLAFYDN